MVRGEGGGEMVVTDSARVGRKLIFWKPRSGIRPRPRPGRRQRGRCGAPGAIVLIDANSWKRI